MRLMTWNLCGAESEACTSGGVAEVLAQAGTDVVALQMTPEELARSVAEQLNWQVVFAPGNEDHGMAVLSRYPIDNMRSHPLPTREGHELRMMLCCCMHAEEPLNICAVHLDNRAEALRVEQLRAVFAQLCSSSNMPMRNVVLCGDINAVSRGDFSDCAWRGLCEVAARHGWEEHSSAAVELCEFLKVVAPGKPTYVIICLCCLSSA
eukprot:jgi/Chlat1/5087/Chrsp33S05105